MPSRGSKLAVAATLAALVCVVYAEVKPKVYDSNVASLSTQEIEDQLQVLRSTSLVTRLNKKLTSHIAMPHYRSPRRPQDRH